MTQVYKDKKEYNVSLIPKRHKYKITPVLGVFESDRPLSYNLLTHPLHPVSLHFFEDFFFCRKGHFAVNNFARVILLLRGGILLL